MKWLLAKIGLPKAIGLYIDEDAVTVSQIVATPLGPVEITRHHEPLGTSGHAEVVRRLVGPLLGKGKFRSVPLAVGVPIERTYFSTRPVQMAAADLSPHVLLREALRSPNVSVNDMVVDVIKAKPDAREVASIVSCDRKYLTGILDVLKESDVCPLRAEPASCALLRVATSRHRTRRNVKVVLRLFLADTRVLSILVVDNLPVVWRFANLSQGEEAGAMLAACRSLMAMSKDCGVEAPLDAVMIHGRPELERLLDVESMEAQLRVSVKWFEEPALNDSQIALGLAQGCLDYGATAFNLARSLRPPLSLSELFPWREAIVQFALLVCMALFLGHSYWTLSESYRSHQLNNDTSAATAWSQKAALEKEKNDLKQRVQAVRKFLDTRVIWTSCVRDLATCIPADMYLTSFQGYCELKVSSKKKRGSTKVKKSLVLRGAVTIPPEGTVPREIDRLLNALRSHPMLERDFPNVNLADLTQTRARNNETPVAIFTIVCLPKKKTSKKRAS